MYLDRRRMVILHRATTSDVVLVGQSMGLLDCLVRNSSLSLCFHWVGWVFSIVLLDGSWYGLNPPSLRYLEAVSEKQNSS